MIVISSESSSASSIVAKQAMGSLQGEIHRRKKRLNSLKGSDAQKKKDKGRSINQGIMTVRTLEESININGLNSSKITDLRRKRRALRALAKQNTFGSTDGNSVSTANFSAGSMRVSYGHITIREYGMIPGDNPGVSRGVPLSLDWQHFWEGNFPVDTYESVKTEPRHHLEMRVPAEVRAKILRDSGSNWKEIQSSIRAANITRRDRLNTLRRLPSQNFDEKVEKLGRGFKKMFGAGKKSRDSHEQRVYDHTPEKRSDLDISQDSKISLQSLEKEKDEIDVSWSHSASNYDLSPGSDNVSNKPKDQKKIASFSSDVGYNRMKRNDDDGSNSIPTIVRLPVSPSPLSDDLTFADSTLEDESELSFTSTEISDVKGPNQAGRNPKTTPSFDYEYSGIERARYLNSLEKKRSRRQPNERRVTFWDENVESDTEDQDACCTECKFLSFVVKVQKQKQNQSQFQPLY